MIVSTRGSAHTSDEGRLAIKPRNIPLTCNTDRYDRTKDVDIHPRAMINISAAGVGAVGVIANAANP